MATLGKGARATFKFVLWSKKREKIVCQENEWLALPLAWIQVSFSDNKSIVETQSGHVAVILNFYLFGGS